MSKMLLSMLPVLALHVLGAWALIRSTAPIKLPARTDSLVIAFIEPAVLRADGTVKEPDLSKLSFVAASPLAALDIKLPRIDYEATRNEAAAMAAPSLDPELIVDIGPYIRRAGLLPGEGETVVLRIEVLDDGSPGKIAIDVSSGSPQVDQAAIDYARAHRWIPAMVTGTAQPVWIRWGIRLQA